jgi:hypothetical protein
MTPDQNGAAAEHWLSLATSAMKSEPEAADRMIAMAQVHALLALRPPSPLPSPSGSGVPNLPDSLRRRPPDVGEQER